MPDSPPSTFPRFNPHLPGLPMAGLTHLDALTRIRTTTTLIPPPPRPSRRLGQGPASPAGPPRREERGSPRARVRGSTPLDCPIRPRVPRHTGPAPGPGPARATAPDQETPGEEARHKKARPKTQPLPPHNHTIPIPVNHPPTRKNAPIPLIQQHR